MVNKFWELSVSQRGKVVEKFGLLYNKEWQLPEPKRYLLAFKRAYQFNVMTELTNAINEMAESSNPISELREKIK